MSDVSGSYSTPSGMTGAGGGQLLRITGMATGLDVDAMVKKMMAAEQTKLDKLKQQQQLIQWKQEAYQGIIKDIKDLQSSFFDITSTNTSVLSASNYSAFDVNMADVYNSAISVSAGIGAQIGTYSVSFTNPLTGVKDGNLAQAAGVKSGDPILGSNGSKAAANTRLSDLGISDSYSFTINYNNGDGKPSAATITVDASTTLSDLAKQINTATGNAVTAKYSELTGAFSIQTSKTGEKTSLSIEVPKDQNGNVLKDADGNDMDISKLLQALNLGDGTTNSVTSDMTDNTIDNKYKIEAKDALVYITPPGGTPTKYTNSQNNFAIDGIGYNLISASDSTFSITQNTQKLHDKIKDFLDKYNAIVDEIQTKLGEKKDKNYPPLTDAQKSSMKDSDIAAWNTKAQQGILRNDTNLQNLLTSLRQAFTTPLKDSNGNKITALNFGNYGSGAIGIDTSSNYEDGGKISIVDDKKLNNAIAQYGDQLMKLFNNVSTSTDKTVNYNESGIFQRINSILKDNVGMIGTTLNSAILTKYANFQEDYSITGGAGSNTLPDQIYYQQLLINKMNDTLSAKQEAYYQQFSKLETAMNQLNAQQSQMTNMLSGN
ncbi:flagellar filament capping protein FliD [Candidatus Clostridium stratigraminis]|uniref:Flagellar hook-associated protein 2 n=1 Tax=Candidatus Clostridium stratigraminis TaxID=3381661 RepID=A0ABW8T4Y4_9CLOT